MMDYKELAENILSDIMNNRPLAEILLKTKIFASKRGDNELLGWVTKELEGYGDEMPPKYRFVSSGLKVIVYIPYVRTDSVDFPIDMIEDENVSNRLSKWGFQNPISEIENLCKNSEKDGRISTKVPVFIYQYLDKFINGDIQDAYQYTTPAAVSQILVSVKSVLIDFLLEVSKEEDIDFNTFIKNNPNMGNRITINAGIVNTGSGSVNAQGATTVVGSNNEINVENKNELLRIIKEIDKIAAEAGPITDYEEVSKDIKDELKKDKPANNFLKRCFQLIPSFLTGLSASVVANQLNPLITAALALL
jgi:hypothetical protein